MLLVFMVQVACCIVRCDVEHVALRGVLFGCASLANVANRKMFLSLLNINVDVVWSSWSNQPQRCLLKLSIWHLKQVFQMKSCSMAKQRGFWIFLQTENTLNYFIFKSLKSNLRNALNLFSEKTSEVFMGAVNLDWICGNPL